MSRLYVAAVAALAIGLVAASPVAAVTGGTPTDRGDYPHLAALLDDGIQYCDGSLVAPGWILTAAHCTEDIDVENLTVEIGGDYLEGSLTWAITDAQNEVRSVSQIIAHPNWDPDAFGYDVAVLKLSSASTKTPLPLADAGSSSDRAQWEGGDPARVIGYGLPSGPEAGIPLETDVHMVSDADCETSHALTLPVDTNTMVCAGEVYGVKDSCFGDSGGPLMAPVTGSDFTTQLMQVGVVSWGTACAVPTQYGVYARVADDPLNDWIQSRIGGGGTSPTTSTRRTGSKPRQSQQQGNKLAPISPGAEVLSCAGKPATIGGTAGRDILRGTPGADVIVALEGNDKIRAGGGSDVICAGAGRDSVSGGSGKDRIYGQRGSDRLRGNRGNDRLFGGSSADRLFGGSGRDRLFGGSGRDRLLGGSGRDSQRH